MLLLRLFGIYGFEPDVEGCSTAIIHSGGVEAIVDAVKTFPKSNQIAAFAWYALENLFSDMEESPVPAKALRSARRFVEELDGLKIVLKAIATFPHDDMREGLHAALIVLLILSRVKRSSPVLSSSRVLSLQSARLFDHTHVETPKEKEGDSCRTCSVSRGSFSPYNQAP